MSVGSSPVRSFLILAAATSLLVFSPRARAQSGKNCTLTNWSASLGSYDPLAPNNTSPLSATCSVSYTCNFTTNGKSVSIALNSGVHSTGGLPNRNLQLSGGTGLMNYLIYLPGSSSTIWGDGTAGTSTYIDPNGVTANVTETVSTTCTIPAGQTVSTGSFFDTVTATITFPGGSYSAGPGNDVSASVPTDCTLTTANILFGNYDPAVANRTAPLDTTSGAVTIKCVTGTSATIGLNLGSNASGTQRRMFNSGAGTYINYQLYQDSAYTVVWGNSAGSYNSPPAAPNQNARTYTIYAQAPGGQNVSVGSYTDNLTASVNF
jgi:spore coat protein U-like protein